MSLEIIPIYVKQDVEEGDNLLDFIPLSKLQDGDVLVISQKVISKQEGRIAHMESVFPSDLAVGIASAYQKDPSLVEIILSDTRRIIRMENGIFIVENNNGFICANAGVDESNVKKGFATLLPLDPDASALRLQQAILKKTGKKLAILISDTFGRPFRIGQTDCAIGLAGICALADYTGKKDTFGKTLRVTSMAIADELCAAAELTSTKTSKSPFVIIRGYSFTISNDTISSLIRDKETDLFR